MEHHPMGDHGHGLGDEVRANLAAYSRVNIVQGEIAAVVAGRSPERIRYLHIDLNQATAAIATLDALFDHVVPVGIIILDDYE